MAESTSILVLGAGELGMAVLRNLAARAHQAPGMSVSVLLRPSTIASSDPRKQQDIDELRSLGIELVQGELASGSPAELSAIFKRFHTVISCTGFVTGSGFQRKLTRAVLDAGVPRYIPWQFGVDYDVIGRGSAQDLFDEQLDVRDLLRSQDRTAWIIISTGMFTSFLFEPSLGVVDLTQDTVHALGSWDNSVTVTTPEDIGKLTAEIVFAEPPIRNQVVYTAGDTITYGRLADIAETASGHTLRREVWTVPELKAELAKAPDNAIKKYRVVFAEGRGVAWDKNRTFNAQRGIEVVDVQRWARENLN